MILNPPENVVKIASHDLFAVAEWIVGGDTRSSSEYMMATALAGTAPKCKWGVQYPHDCADLGRCIRLVQKVPSVRSALPILAAASPQWAALAPEWDALVTLHDKTAEADYKRARIVSSRMRVLFASANADVRRDDGTADRTMPA